MRSIEENKKEVDYMESESMVRESKKLKHAQIDAKIALLVYQTALFRELHKKVDRGEQLNDGEMKWITEDEVFESDIPASPKYRPRAPFFS